MKEGLKVCVFVVDWQVLAGFDPQAKAVCVRLCVCECTRMDSLSIHRNELPALRRDLSLF